MHQTLLIFSIVAFVGIATPGPTVLLALTNGSRFGVRASIPGMAGAVLSDFVLISAVAIGLGSLLAASAFWFSVVKWSASHIWAIWAFASSDRVARSQCLTTGTSRVKSRPDPFSF